MGRNRGVSIEFAMTAMGPIGDIGSPISSGDPSLMNPITGIASCCARAM
jgi:hypothetical protein